MKVIIAGTRTITDYDVLLRTIAHAPFSNQISEVIVGCAENDFGRGKLNFDVLGYVWGKLHRKRVHCHPVFPSEWRELGKAAGPLRNERMALEGDGLIACWDGKSPGTSDMITRALGYVLPVFVEPLYPQADYDRDLWFLELLGK